jgi:hypothetical protein
VAPHIVCLKVEVEEIEFNPFEFIAQLPPKPDFGDRLLLPPTTKDYRDKITLGPHPLSLFLVYSILCKEYLSRPLVLDLDETLVHCSLEVLEHPDLVITVPYAGVDNKVFPFSLSL